MTDRAGACVNRPRRVITVLAALAAAIPLLASAAGQPSLRLPPGFSAEVLVPDVPGARSMALGEGGTLFVATQRAGKVYAVADAFSGKPRVLTLLEDRKLPNGVAMHEGDLYVGEPSQILKFESIESRLDAPGEPEIVIDDLPFKNVLHAWKYLAFGPDERLYVPFGAPCNICDEPDFARILSMRPDGSDRTVIATGVRNSVGFDWHPVTGEFWFTDNGRDMLGDDLPPCELNRASSAGLDFGFPYCHGSDVVDPEFGELGDCADATLPVQALDPHSAPLGMKFYTGDMFPAEYRNQVFIAEHGSWNRSEAAGKTGYRVSLVRLDGNRAIAYEPFLEGFVQGDDAVGRPVDILVAPDGALLVSDDKAGAIYRISYQEGR